MKLTEVWHRFRLGSEKPWPEREQVKIDTLAVVRAHPGFAALLDVFDSEVVTLFEKWLDTEPSKAADLRDLHAQGRSICRMIQRMDQATTARDTAAAIERQHDERTRMVNAHRVDKEARRVAVASAIAQRAANRETALTGSHAGG